MLGETAFFSNSGMIMFVGLGGGGGVNALLPYNIVASDMPLIYLLP